MPMPMGTERVTRKIMKSGSTWIRLDTMAFSEMMEDTTIPTMPFRMFSFSEVYQLVGLMALLIPSSESIAANGEFYSAAEWDVLNFQYLQIYDENGARQTGITQIYLLSAAGNFICFDKSTKIERADGSLVKIEDLCASGTVLQPR